MSSYMDQAKSLFADSKNKRDQECALMSSIESELKSLRREASDLEALAGVAVVEAIRENGLELFSNPESARELYDFGWSNGRGIAGFEKAFTKMFNLPVPAISDWEVLDSFSIDDSYYAGEDPYSTDNLTVEHKTAAVLSLTLITRNRSQLTEEEIADIAEKLEPVMKVQAKILEDFDGKSALLVSPDGGAMGSRITYNLDTDTFEVTNYYAGILCSNIQTLQRALSVARVIPNLSMDDLY